MKTYYTEFFLIIIVLVGAVAFILAVSKETNEIIGEDASGTTIVDTSTNLGFTVFGFIFLMASVSFCIWAVYELWRKR